MGYEYDGAREEFKHIVYGNWNKDFEEKSIAPQDYWAFRTLYNITESLYNEIIGESKNNKDLKTPKIPTTTIAPKTSPLVEVFTEEEERFFL